MAADDAYADDADVLYRQYVWVKFSVSTLSILTAAHNRTQYVCVL